MQKKLTAALALALLVSCGAAALADAAETAAPGQDGPVVLTEAELAQGYSFAKRTEGNFQLSYPVFNYNGKASVKINNDIQKTIARFMSYYFNNEDVTGWIESDVVYNGEDYVSVQMDMSHYFKGAAHPMHYAHAMVYDKKTGKRMKVKNFMSLPKPEELDAAVRRGEVPLLAASGERIELGDFFDVRSISSQFIVDDKELKLVYSPYDLGPYAVGTTYLVFPLPQK